MGLKVQRPGFKRSVGGQVIASLRELSTESRYKWWQVGRAVVFQIFSGVDLMPALKICNRLGQTWEVGVG